MNITHRYALDAFRQVQDFMDKNGTKIGALTSCAPKKVLDDVVGILENARLDQESWTLEMNGQASLQKSLEAELYQHMKAIAKYARARLRGVPEYAALAVSSGRFRGRRLVAAARAMAKAADAYKSGLTEAAFPEDALEQLNGLADQLEASLDSRYRLKVTRVQATRGIKAETARGFDAVKMLDAVLERQFNKDEAFLASWRTAKRVLVKPGVPRGKSVAPQEASGGSPVAA